MTSIHGKKKNKEEPVGIHGKKNSKTKPWVMPRVARTFLALKGARGAEMLRHFVGEEDDPEREGPGGLYEAAVAIADKNRILLLELEAAYLTKDNAALRKAAAALLGIKDEKGNRANTRKH